MAEVGVNPSSAQGYSQQPYENALSYDEWVAKVYPHEGFTDDAAQWILGDNMFAKLGNLFSGSRSQALNDYNAYVQALNKRNEEKGIANARAYDEWFESTKYQRAVEDLKKAGLNPWLAVNSGFANQSSATTTNSSAKGVEFQLQEQKGALAGLLSMIAKLIAG